MKDIRQRLLATFHVEHKEHVRKIRETLTALEQSGPPLAAADLDEVFRRAHSLKGAARAVDLRPLENLSHRMETLFSRVREGDLRLDEPAIKVLFQALDASEDWLAAMTEARNPVEPAAVLAAIDGLLGMGKEKEGKAGNGAEAKATQTLIPSRRATSLQGHPLPEGEGLGTPVPQLETVRLHAESLDRIVNTAGQLLTEGLRQDRVTEEMRQIDRQFAETAVEKDRLRKAGARVFRKLESSPEFGPAARYVNYLDHQLHVLAKHAAAARRLQARNAWTLRALTGELQQDVRQARMMPAEGVFEGFRKMVRDLARDEGKSAELRVAGAAVEADRIVLQALKDPVMHILRNAVSHGIEPESERKARGKSAAGRLDLTLEARGNQLLIVVEDDGRGVDLIRVAEIAARKGLLGEGGAAARTPAELLRLVLLPGFSTTRFVTEVSGRGMGLSVVAEAVARLQGKVDIEPAQSGGTRITLAAPLSVSSHRLLLVRCQTQTLAVPIHAIERLQRVNLADLQTVESRPTVGIRGRQIPVVSLAHLLNSGEPGVNVTENTLCLMLMRTGTRRLAVAVDAFISERDAIIKDLPAPANKNARIAGGILLEDGSVCLVLNPAEILDGFQQSANALVFRTAAETAVERTKSVEILVVDDSMTTRMLEKSVLEAHGYKVSTAVDGIEALKHLRAEPVGLVISDLQMPRLDGFGLLEEMKRDPRLDKIPVIIVSSVEDRENQARGMELGADAYIVKRRFEQRELLETIRQIL